MFLRLIKLFISACFFVSDRMLGRTDRHVVLYYHGIKAGEVTMFIRQMRAVARRTGVVITFDDALECIAEHALPVTRDLGIPVTIFVPVGYLGMQPGWMSPSIRNKDMVMSQERIRQLSEDTLITWGSHAVTHTRFTDLTEQEVCRELCDSRKILEGILGRPVDTFSFPHGAYRKRDLELAEHTGYRVVYTIMPHKERQAGHVRVIGRVKVDPSDWPIEFRLKLSGAYRWQPWASALKRRLVCSSE